MVTTYLPLFIEDLSGPATTGLLIGAEGLMALLVPLVSGGWSDRLETRLGGRLPFLLAATPVLVVVLVLMPLSRSLPILAVLLLVFYVAYFVYYPPYRALYPDLVRSEERGRSQGLQKTLRELGLVAALIGGGLLIAIWKPLPFVIAAVALTIATIVAVEWLRRHGAGTSGSGEGGDGDLDASASLRAARELLADPRIRWFAVANGLWEAALGTIKAFVVLFFVVGLGRSTEFGSAVLAFAAIAIIAAALIGGKLADRLGEGRLLRIAVPVYGIGLLAPLISQSVGVLAIVPLVAFAGGIVMTLPFSMLMSLMGSDDHGSASGLFELSRGAGALLGPLIAGLAITLAEPLLSSTHGYAAMWAVASAAVLLSRLALARAERAAAR